MSFDYIPSAGYLKGGLMTTGSFSQQRTQGGGDIRRQDMPFVSNRMNFSKVGGMVMFPCRSSPPALQVVVRLHVLTAGTWDRPPRSPAAFLQLPLPGENDSMRMTRTRGCRLAAGATALMLTVVVAHSQLTPVAAAPNNDADAGTWQMIVLTGPTQIRGGAAGAGRSFDYQAELTAIKSAQARLTSAQRKAIDYWSGGGVLRWNEIMLELVARADLPPAPSPDGTYPVPDANNPFADPNFPFGNPPYAARAYSYVARRAVRSAEGRRGTTSISTTVRRRRRSTAASRP